jgi:hypothetical protein
VRTICRQRTSGKAPGITSSIAEAGTNFGIGYAEASQLTSGVPTVFGSFDGDAGLARFTY